MDDFAVFMFGVFHLPMSDRAFPYTGAKLAARAFVVVVEGALGVTFDQALGSRAVMLGLGGGLGEINDLFDAHGWVLGFLLLNKTHMTKAFVGVMSNILKIPASVV
ncbi:hypothetical protein D3C81_1729320 [compost metagenome]